MVKFINKPRQTQKIKLAKQTEYKTTTPSTVLEMYKKLNIFDVENYDSRAIMIAKYLAQKKYRLNTAMKYFEFVRRDGIIGDSPIQLNKRMFDIIKQPQQRIPSIDQFKKCIVYLHEQINNPLYQKMDSNEYHSKEIRKVNLAYAVLFVYYTGLRSFEVCSITNKILYELLNYEMVINLDRKNSDKWNVVYSKHFQIFLLQMKRFYGDYLNMYTEKQVILKLFNVSMNYLHHYLNTIYVIVNHEEPPVGFGLHSIRYIIATSLAQNNNLEAAKLFLGHADVKTTQVYLKYHNIHASKRLNEISIKDPFYNQMVQELNK